MIVINFLEKLEIVHPEVVLVLGKETAKFVSKVFPDECSKWAAIKTLKSLYAEEDNISVDINFNDKVIHFLFVIHPSLNNTNRSITWGKKREKQKNKSYSESISGTKRTNFYKILNQ